ncbi:hypothetical protein O3G_MSEX000624 [Manduca sexta]|nr:hypothetical protein O3G_MSEX000624 [Manduca sexta]
MDDNITMEINNTTDIKFDNETTSDDNDTERRFLEDRIKEFYERNVSYIGNDITKRDEDIITIFFRLAPVGIIFLFFLIYVYRNREGLKELKNYIAIQHLLSGLLRESCVIYYDLDLGCGEKEVTEATYSCLDLVICLSTLSLSGVVFLKLFFFPNGESLYNKKDISIFSTVSVTILELSEQVFALFDYNDRNLPGALRFTSILFIMSVPVVICLLIFSTLFFKSSEIPKQEAVFYAVHLFVFISSDLLLVASNLEMKNYGNVMEYFQILMYVRLVVEMVWYVISNSWIRKL